MLVEYPPVEGDERPGFNTYAHMRLTAMLRQPARSAVPPAGDAPDLPRVQ